MASEEDKTPALLGWTLLGIALTFGFSLAVLGGFVHLVDGGGSWVFTGHHLEQGQWYEAVRNTVALVALTVAGGAAYLAYRRQKTADLTQLTTAAALKVSSDAYSLSVDRHQADEVRQLRARFSEAAEQLSHPSAAVRTAGVYSLASLAEDWSLRDKVQEVQVCIDVLCGYLRLPYSPEIGANHLTKRVFQRTKGGVGKTQGGTEEHHYEYRQNDKVVRQTVLRVIRSHLQEDSEHSWSHHNFDFAGVVFEDAHLINAKFAGNSTSFIGAVFLGETTSFHGVMFAGRNTSFERASFHGDITTFLGASFTGESVWFDEAVFDGRITVFERAKFDGQVIQFNHVTFGSESTTFYGAVFGGESLLFRDSRFIGDMRSDGAEFSGETVDFSHCEFAAGASFGEPTAWKNVIFDWNDLPASMPAGVSPRNWPPVVETSEP